MNLKKYHLLPNADQEVLHVWTKHDLRRFTITYISVLKRKKNVSNDLSNIIYWSLYNLEYLGKPRMAEIVYIYCLQKGLIGGL